MKAGDTAAALAEVMAGTTENGGTIALVGNDPMPNDKVEPQPKAKPDFLKEYLCKVIELDKPYAEDQHVFSVSSRDGWEVTRVFRANREVMLPRVLIDQIRRESVYRESVLVTPDSAFYGNAEEAKKHNPGMKYTIVGGMHRLVRERPRFTIEILDYGEGPDGRIT